jgi:hypothetical protein
MLSHSDSKIYLSEERSGRNILPRNRVTTNGAILLTLCLVSLYAAVARISLKGAKARDNIERNARTSIDQSSRG